MTASPFSLGATLLLLGFSVHAQTPNLPGPITNLLADVRSAGGTVIHLSWTAAEWATNYEVWRSTSSDFAAAEKVAATTSGASKFNDDLTRAGTNYSYWVKGLNVEGAGPLSTPATAVQTSQLWAFPVGQNIFAAPLVSTNGTIYALSRTASWKGEVAAFRPDGTKLWTFACDGWPATSGAITVNGNLVFSTQDAGSAIYCVNPSGELIWRTPLNQSSIYSSLAVDAYGTCYVLADYNSSSTTLFALSIDGVLLWRALIPGNQMDRPSIGIDGTVFAATTTELDALEPGGSTRWKIALPFPKRNWFPPSLGENGDLYTGLGSINSFMRVGVNGLTRASNYLAGMRWSAPRESVVSSDGRVLTITDNSGAGALCLNTNGVPIWTNRFSPGFSDSFTAVPALDALGNAYVFSASDLVILDREGREVSRIEMASRPSAPPVLTPGGYLYLADGNRLRAAPARAGLDLNSPWPMFRRNPQGTASMHAATFPPSQPSLLPPNPYANLVRIESGSTLPPAALVLFRSTTTNFADATLVARGRVGEAFADDTNAVPGLSYYYWARLENPAGISELSGPVLARAASVPIKWRLDAPDLSATSPAVAPDGTVYASGTGRLIAIDPTTGTQKWEVPGLTGTPMVSARGDIVLRTGDTVFSLSTEGKTNWSLSGVNAHAAALPAVGPDGRVLVLAAPDTVLALSSTGVQLWQNQVTNHALYPLALDRDGSAILMDGQVNWARISPDGSNTIVFGIDAYFQAVAPPVLDSEGTLYYPCLNELIAVRPDGTNKWKFPIAAVNMPVVGADGTVFQGHTVRTRVKGVSAINPNGTLRWTFEVGDASTVYPVISGDALVVAAAGTNLFALDVSSGALVWQMGSPYTQPFGPPTLDYDGTLCLPVSGAIMAVQLKAGPPPLGWPMDRQNPRRSACLARAALPRLSFVQSQKAVSVLAPEGAILLRSGDLESWSRLGVVPPSDASATWPISLEGSSGFFRVLSP